MAFVLDLWTLTLNGQCKVKISSLHLAYFLHQLDDQKKRADKEKNDKVKMRHVSFWYLSTNMQGSGRLRRCIQASFLAFCCLDENMRIRWKPFVFLLLKSAFCFTKGWVLCVETIVSSLREVDRPYGLLNRRFLWARTQGEKPRREWGLNTFLFLQGFHSLMRCKHYQVQRFMSRLADRVTF